jgi:hypothetical protein
MRGFFTTVEMTKFEVEGYNSKMQTTGSFDKLRTGSSTAPVTMKTATGSAQNDRV